MNDLTPYGQERWLAGSKWRPGLKPDEFGVAFTQDEAGQVTRLWTYPLSKKPFLTAADLVLLRDMKVGL